MVEYLLGTTGPPGREHILADLSSRQLLSHHSGGLKTKVKVLAELVSGEAALPPSSMCRWLPPPVSFLPCVHTSPCALCLPSEDASPTLMTSLNLSTSSKALHTVSLEFRVSMCKFGGRARHNGIQCDWDRVQSLKKGAEKGTDNCFDFRVRFQHKPRFHSLGGSTGHVWLSPCVQGSGFADLQPWGKACRRKDSYSDTRSSIQRLDCWHYSFCLTLDLVYNYTKPFPNHCPKDYFLY